MCHMKTDVTFFEYIEIVYFALILILHSLSINNMFVSHISLGHEYIELRFSNTILKLVQKS